MTERRARPLAKRADARRNIATILDTAADCLARDPATSMGELARAAGVGRVTLYAHFDSRAELIDAVVERAIDHGDQALESVDLSGDPRAALERLIAVSWLLIVQIGALTSAAAAVLPPDRLLELHERPARRVEWLVERGRTEGVFRVDLPSSWLVGLLHRVMHGAAAEIEAGRLSADEAPRVIAATVLAAYTPPGNVVPPAMGYPISAATDRA